MDPFVHLDARSAFSFLWGTCTPEDLVARAAALGQPAVGLADDGLFGTVRFCRAASEAGVQPVAGARVLLADGSRLVLLARNRTGYSNLCRLLSISYQEGLLPRPRTSFADLRRLSEGLICLAGGWDSPLHRRLAAGETGAARARLQKLASVFSRPRGLFVVLPGAGGDEGRLVCRRSLRLAREMNLPPVAAGGPVYLKPEDADLHRILVGVQRRHHHRRIDPLPGRDFFPASGQEMVRRTGSREAAENTVLIAELCRDFSLPLGRLHPPAFQPPAEASRRLARVCLTEMARRLRPAPVRYLRRLEGELAAIDRLQMADFFLVVRDVVRFARSRNIRHSVRGSAAGSLAVFLTLGGVDPEAHGLLFERFINEGRRDLPDVDIDFDSERREEVIHYLMDRFPGQTAMTATIHKLKVRSAVRLTARALGYPLDEIKRLSACLPWSLKGYDLAAALELLPELRDAPLRRESRLVETATRLARLPYQSSVHLGGVIIAPGDINDWTPVGLSPGGLPVGQLDKDDIEHLGLLKFDILGLRMHTAIRKALKVLEEQGRSLPLAEMPLDDARTYRLLRSTSALGVFQVESPGQRQLLGRLQPTRFADLIAEISLFRPGPVEGNIVDPFVRRRNGEEPVRHFHPDLAPVLEETYGLILFQEQVLRIVHVFAGLPYAEADAFRRVMTKDRKSRRMEMLKERFIAAAAEKGRDPETAEEVWRQVCTLAAYGFCKAHAASFAHITYQSAYLKAHHPQAFYLGLLNAGQVGSYPASVILNEARRRGLPVHPPHVNRSGDEYLAEGRGIRAPLWVIHQVGPALAVRIRDERERSGLYASREEFTGRTRVPERTLAALETAGALEGLPRLTRRMFSLETACG